MKKYLMVLVLFFLSGCAATYLIPKINIVKSMGMTMELNKMASISMSVAISPDSKYGLSTGKSIEIWDLSEGKLINRLTGHEGGIRKVAFSPNGQYIISGGMDKAIRTWDFSSGTEIRQFIGHRGVVPFGVMVSDVAISPDGSKVLSVSDSDKTIKLWDFKTGNEITTLPVASHVPRSAAFSPVPRSAVFSRDGKYILTSVFTAPPVSIGGAMLWDAATSKHLKSFWHEIAFKPNMINAVDISPDGKYALTGGMTGMIKLWDIASGKEMKAYHAHPGLFGVYSASFSPDGKYILSAGGDAIIKLFDISTGKEMRQFIGHSDQNQRTNIFEAVFSPDGKHILSGGSDAAVRLWDVSTGDEIAMLVCFEDGEWLVVTREGYYNTSAKGAEYLTVKVEDKSYTVDQFYDVFYRPDIVAAKLRGEDTKDLITITMKDAIKSPPPTVEIAPVKEAGTSRVKVCYQIKNAGGGIGEVRLFLNGKLIESDGYYREVVKSTGEKTQLASLNSRAIYEDMRAVTIKGITGVTTTTKPKGALVDACKEIEAVPGDNEVSVTAFNGNNTIQGTMKTVSFHTKLQLQDPHLYILSIGIDTYKDRSVNLKYAMKDASDIEEKLVRQSATMYRPENIHYELLVNERATRENIIKKIDELAKIIRPTDGFIFFVASHGLLLQNQYYILTHEYDGTISDDNTISSNTIIEMSKKIKSLGQLFIFDTCHAGGVDNIVRGLYDARMSVLAKKMGLHIYASASDRQSAIDGYKGNGLFSYTLLDGLNNNRAADKNKDGSVTVVGLGEYSKKMTTDISKEIGHRQTPLIINFGRDNPIYKLQ